MNLTARKILLFAAVLLLPFCAQAQQSEITVKLPGEVPLEMVWIEPGTFTMGGEPDLVSGNSVHGPQHQVMLTKGFYIGKYETTQAQWTAVMGTKPWEGHSDGFDCPNCPENLAKIRLRLIFLQ